MGLSFSMFSSLPLLRIGITIEVMQTDRWWQKFMNGDVCHVMCLSSAIGMLSIPVDFFRFWIIWVTSISVAREKCIDWGIWWYIKHEVYSHPLTTNEDCELRVPNAFNSLYVAIIGRETNGVIKKLPKCLNVQR